MLNRLKLLVMVLKLESPKVVLVHHQVVKVVEVIGVMVLLVAAVVDPLVFSGMVVFLS